MSTPPCTPQPASDPRGFTLVELVLALAIIGSAFLSVLWVRTAAVSRAAEFTRDRKVQRIAQEKLDEVLFGIEQETTGVVEELLEGEWEIEVYNRNEAGETPLYATRITIRYQDENLLDRDYSLSKWILFTSEESILPDMIDQLDPEGVR